MLLDFEGDWTIFPGYGNHLVVAAGLQAYNFKERYRLGPYFCDSFAPFGTGYLEGFKIVRIQILRCEPIFVC